MKLDNIWQYEVAAMLSQLGCVTLAPETVDAVYKGESLTPNEQAQYAAHPSVAYDLLSRIPRLEPVAWMIEHQNKPVSTEHADTNMRRGAEILRLILSYEGFIHSGKSRTEAVHLLMRLHPQFSPAFFDALVTLDPNAEEGELKKCAVEELSPGMIIQDELRSPGGTLIVSKGQEVTPTVIFRLKNLLARGERVGRVTVSLPTTESALGAGDSDAMPTTTKVRSKAMPTA